MGPSWKCTMLVIQGPGRRSRRRGRLSRGRRRLPMNDSQPRFGLGDRVRVLDEHHWAAGATATVSRGHPDLVRTGEFEVYWRAFTTNGQKKIEYWVEFDTPQFDVDGDGPYD